MEHPGENSNPNLFNKALDFYAQIKDKFFDMPSILPIMELFNLLRQFKDKIESICFDFMGDKTTVAETVAELENYLYQLEIIKPELENAPDDGPLPMLPMLLNVYNKLYREGLSGLRNIYKVQKQREQYKKLQEADDYLKQIYQ